MKAGKGTAWKTDLPGTKNGTGPTEPQCRSGGVLLELGLQRRLLHGADHLVDELAVLEEQDRRNRPHVEARRRLDVAVDIELRDLRFPRVLGRELVDDRRDHAAGAAPGRPEVNDREPGVLLDLRLEIPIIHCQGTCHPDLHFPRLRRRGNELSLSAHDRSGARVPCHHPNAAERESPMWGSRCGPSAISFPSVETSFACPTRTSPTPMEPGSRVSKPASRSSSCSKPSVPIRRSESSS